MDNGNLNKKNGWLGWWPRLGIRAILDPENGRIEEFLYTKSTAMKPGAKVLDAGAGTRPYAPIFANHQYNSCDMPGGFYRQKHDFECFLDDIPQPDETYDAVILTQVLEHVPEPEKVLGELFRILKKDGVLLITVPLNGPLHGEPWHFFQFTHHALENLATKVGFEVVEIEKIGGAFWFLGKQTPVVFRKLLKQFDPFRAKKRNMSVTLCIFMTVLLLPVYFLAYIPSAYVIRPLCYWLDMLDREKVLTFGYSVVMRKPDK